MRVSGATLGPLIVATALTCVFADSPPAASPQPRSLAPADLIWGPPSLHTGLPSLAGMLPFAQSLCRVWLFATP